MIISYKKRKISIEVKKLSEFGKVRGLMFRSLENSPNLLFEFNKKKRQIMHSLFVFFPFLVLWLDGNEVKEIQYIDSFRLSIKPKNNYNKCIEIPFNRKNRNIIAFFDGKRKI